MRAVTSATLSSIGPSRDLAASGARGNTGRLCRPLPNAAGESMAETHRDDADEQVDHLDHPMVSPGEQAQLSDAHRWNQESPKERHDCKTAAVARHEPENDEHQQSDDEEAAEQHVQRQERHGMSGPEENSEREKSNAEETVE